MRYILFAALVSCTAPRHEPLPALCDVPSVDTTGWQEFTNDRQTFTIKLPPGARELGATCLHSSCGKIAAGAWTFRYDYGGRYARQEHPLRPDRFDTEARVCERRVGLRRLQVVTARYRDTRGPQALRPESSLTAFFDDERAGQLVTRAIVPILPSVGVLDLEMFTPRETDRAEFLTALQTIRILYPDRAFPTPDSQR